MCFKQGDIVVDKDDDNLEVLVYEIRDDTYFSGLVISGDGMYEEGDGSDYWFIKQFKLKQ